MWLFFTRRLRAWLILTVLVPLAGGLLRRVAQALERRHGRRGVPDALLKAAALSARARGGLRGGGRRGSPGGGRGRGGVRPGRRPAAAGRGPPPVLRLTARHAGRNGAIRSTMVGVGQVL